MTHYNIPIFVPHLGCPNDCVFCNQKKITGTKSDFSSDNAKLINDAKIIIEKNLASIEQNNKERFTEIAFFGGSFTAIEKDVFENLCLLASKYAQNGRVDGIRCSTRPDCIDDEKLLFMKKCGFTMIELGAQSTDDLVLLKSRRGHTRDDIINASQKIKSHNLGLGLQMMVGLPFDTKEKLMQTTDDIISLKPDCVRVYPTLVIEGTKLFDMQKNGDYLPLDVKNAAILCADVLEKFYKNNINVIRVGLQITDEINENTVLGPCHSSFREICESMIFRNKIERLNLKNDTVIYVNPKSISTAIGNKKSNIDYFLKEFGIKIKFLQDENVDKNEIFLKNI